MKTTYLRINPADNVAVAISPLHAGETIEADGRVITLRTDVPAGHKVTLKNFQASRLERISLNTATPSVMLPLMCPKVHG